MMPNILNDSVIFQMEIPFDVPVNLNQDDECAKYGHSSFS